MSEWWQVVAKPVGISRSFPWTLAAAGFYGTPYLNLRMTEECLGCGQLRGTGVGVKAVGVVVLAGVRVARLVGGIVLTASV